MLHRRLWRWGRSHAYSGTDAGADGDAYPCSNAGSDTETNSHTHAGSDCDPDTRSHSDANAYSCHANAGSNANTGIASGAPANDDWDQSMVDLRGKCDSGRGYLEGKRCER